MPDHVDSVKGYVRLMEGWRRNALAKNDDKIVAAYDTRLEFLQGLIDEVEHLRRITKPIPASYGDLSDLPPELMKELSGIKVDELEQQIYTIIKNGDDVDLDAVLIELFRRFQVVQTRRFLQNKLWRMAQRGLVFSVQGRKGIYTAKSPEDGLDSPQPSPRKSAFDDDLDNDVPF